MAKFQTLILNNDLADDSYVRINTGSMTVLNGELWAVSASNAISASYATTASYAMSSSWSIYSIYSLSASLAQQAISSSYAETSSWALNSITASYAETSSWAINAISSSYADTSSWAINAISSSYAATSSWAINAISSSYANTASYAIRYTNLSGSTVNSLNVNLNSTALRGVSDLVLTNLSDFSTRDFILTNTGYVNNDRFIIHNSSNRNRRINLRSIDTAGRNGFSLGKGMSYNLMRSGSNWMVQMLGKHFIMPGNPSNNDWINDISVAYGISVDILTGSNIAVGKDITVGSRILNNDVYSSGINLFGSNLNVVGRDSIYIGNSHMFSGSNNTVIGYVSKVNGTVNSETKASMNNSFILGNGTLFSDSTIVNNAIVLGNDNQVSGSNIILIGSGSKNYDNGIIIGNTNTQINLQTVNKTPIIIGHNNNTDGDSIIIGHSSSINDNSYITNYRSTIVGNESLSNESGISVGYKSDSRNSGISIGNFSAASFRSVSFGANANSDENAVALGSNAVAKNSSIAIGDNAGFYVLTSTGNTAINSIMIGRNSYASASYTISIGDKTENEYPGSIATKINIESFQDVNAYIRTFSWFLKTTSSFANQTLTFRGDITNGVIQNYKIPTKTVATLHLKFTGMYADGTAGGGAIKSYTVHRSTGDASILPITSSAFNSHNSFAAPTSINLVLDLPNTFSVKVTPANSTTTYWFVTGELTEMKI